MVQIETLYHVSFKIMTWMKQKNCDLEFNFPWIEQKMVHLTQFLPMHPFSTPWRCFSATFWCFQGVEEGCIRNE